MKHSNWLLLTIALVLMLIPLWLPVQDADSSFAGTDDQATTAIIAIHPDYQPWFALWEPPSETIENLLFTLQAALGGGLLGYVIGYRRGQRRPRNHDAGN